jgi:hypothetical protein
MKWPHHRNLRNRPPTPSKGRGPVQVRIRRAFIASGAEVLSSTQIYDWTHSRRRIAPQTAVWGLLADAQDAPGNV